MKIVIINAYCYLNKGDAGIINSMVKEFKKKYSKSDITVVSLFPDIDDGKYGDCKVIGPIFNNYHGRIIYLWALRNLSFYFFRLFTNWLGIVRNKTVKEISSADLVVSCGGGFFQIRSLADYILGFLPHMIQMRTAIQFKKPLVFYAQTIGRFSDNKFVMSEVKRVLMSAKLIMVRESISYNYLKKILGSSAQNYFQTGDAAFLLEKHTLSTQIIPSDSKKHIGITVREWNFPGQSNSKQLIYNYKKSIVDLINDLVRDKNVSVYFLPQVIGPGSKSDLIFSQEIYNKLTNPRDVYVVKEDLTPEELKYAYSELDLLVGTRMHSNIFALSEKVPCVAISYDPKTDGIMRDLELSEYVIDINHITSKNLIAITKKALENLTSIKNQLIRRIPLMQRKSMENNRMIFNLLSNDKS